MPSGFDDFSSRADRDYSDVNKQQQANALLLEEIMLKHGFISIYYEWWHFADEKRDSFPVVEEEELLADKTGGVYFSKLSFPFWGTGLG